MNHLVHSGCQLQVVLTLEQLQFVQGYRSFHLKCVCDILRVGTIFDNM